MELPRYVEAALPNEYLQPDDTHWRLIDRHKVDSGGKSRSRHAT
jgi:hypothetical protein